MALDITRIRGLCFDIDGTLSDTDDRMVERLRKGLTPLRRAMFGRDPGHVARRIVMGVESPGNFLVGIPDRLGMDRQLAGVVNFVNRLGLGRYHTEFWLIPQIKEMLEALRPHYRMAVVSARDERSTAAFLAQFSLAPYFDAVVTAHTCEHTKPYPDPVVWAADRMGYSPEQCVMVGDTTVDIRAGKSAGAQTVGVLCGFGEEKELTRSGADLILPSTALLAEVLLERQELLLKADPGPSGRQEGPGDGN